MQNVFTQSGQADQPRYRSGAVARMVRIPVSTLRIWERRYQVVAPPQTATGHRLYSGTDVERLLLIKQLVDWGHAIGSVASLPSGELLRIAEARATLEAPAGSQPSQRPRAVLLGVGLARRLGVRRLQRVAAWASLADAEAPPDEDDSAQPPQADLLVAELATLQPDSARRLVALMQRLGVRRSVVVYGFGTDAAADLLRSAGCQPRRAPLPDAELRALVDDAIDLLAGPVLNTPLPLPTEVPTRLFDDDTLMQLAADSSTVACECPRHIADLVRMLANFETYSTECVNRNPADAQLHEHLQQVSGVARALFESALLRVAQAEGLMLPPELQGAR